MKNFFIITTSALVISLSATAGPAVSGGDQSINGQTPVDKFEDHVLLNCQVSNTVMSIEVRKPSDSWSNSGVVRILAPKPSGGGTIIFQEKYNNAMTVDPISNEVTMNISAQPADINANHHLVLQLTLNPKASKLKFTNASYWLTSDIFGESSRNEISCSWGKAKTMWD